MGARAFDLLLLLVQQAGVVVNSRELMRAVWPNINVEEANLRVQMGLLRKALSQCGDSRRMIETIPLRGYCFVLPVRHHPSNLETPSSKLPADSALPTLLNPTIGREDTIEIVHTALDEHRLVTITGPGGIGKTTVAIATAKRYAVGYKGEIAFVELSRVVDGAQAAQRIADALGIDARSDALAALCELLRVRELLLILDTCEHLVEPIANLAEFLLTNCDNVKLLVTSREALRATGEWTYRLPSLTFPAIGEEINSENVATFTAINLFVERARSTTRFDVESADLLILAEICRRLDGIPLALEFAAARVADLGLARIAAHLDDRFSILTRGRRTALPRHRTLSATIDWSFSLLSDNEQRMLRLIATFCGAFTGERAIESGGSAGCERPREALSGLYEKSLLTIDLRNGVPLYRLLDTTKAYVAAMLANHP